ncbi:MAG: PIG-L family deacetylase [Verrucomicrobiota bacterium]
MKIFGLSFLLSLLGAGLTVGAGGETTNSPAALTLAEEDRLLIFAPHPDDESLTCAGLIQAAVAMNVPVRVVWLTNGDNNEWSFILYRHHLVIKASAERAMGEVRHAEAVAAMKAVGLGAEHLTFLGYPDFGTLHIWNSHWGDRPPFKSMLTKVTAVPYADSFRPGAPYKGQDIVRDITANLREFKPTKVFCSHPSDLNVDHQALYLFTRIALWDVEKEMQPVLYPFPVHAAKWPRPAGLHPQVPLVPPSQYAGGGINWAAHSLTKSQMAVKEAALRAHVSQMNYSKGFMLSMVRANELFGDFPPVVLADVAPATAHATGHFQRAPELHGELTEAERAKFVGVEQVRMWRVADDLVMAVNFSRPLGKEVSATVSAFGYRSDRPFEQMPKLRVVFGPVKHEVFDQERLLPADTVRLQRAARQVTVRIPLVALGNPPRALTSVHTYLGVDPLDWAEWRVVEIGAQPAL